MSKVLIRKQQGIQYQQMIEQPKQRGSLARDLAALGGGAIGLNAQGGQGFVSGQGQAGRPTRMQRLGAGANLAGRGLAAALTGFQTAHSLQGGNVGAVASARDQYRANVGGLTGGQPTEMQRTQDIATSMYNTQEEENLKQQIRDAAQQQMASQVPASTPPQPQQNVPLPTDMANPNSAGPSRVAINPPQQLTGPPVPTSNQTNTDPSLPPVGGPIPLPTAAQQPAAQQPAAPTAMTPEQVAQTIPPPAPEMFSQPPAPAPPTPASTPAPAPAPPTPASTPAPAPAAPAPAAPAPAAPAPAAPAPAAPADNTGKTTMIRPMNTPVTSMNEDSWENQPSWVDEESTFNDNRRVDNTGKTGVLRPIQRMNEDGYSTGWDATPAEIQRQKEFDARRQEERYQPRKLTPPSGATPKSTHAGNFIRRNPTVPMDEDRDEDRPVAVKTPVNTGGMGSNAMEDTKIPTLRDNPFSIQNPNADLRPPKGSNQERLQREESNKQEEESANEFEDIYAGHDWMNNYARDKPFWEQSDAKNPFARKSFIQMIFNEFGDMLRKADPHVAGLLAMRIYMDKFMR